MELKTESKRNTKLWVGCTLTVIWLSLIAIYLYTSDDNGQRIFQLWKGVEPNAFGDFLAGVFAPLAFLWLLLAVLIQKDEFNEQTKQFKIQSEAQRGTEKVQSVVLAHSILTTGVKILSSEAVDFCQQLISADDKQLGTLNASTGDFDLSLTMSFPPMIFEEIINKMGKENGLKTVEEELRLAVERVASGDLSAIFAVVGKQVNRDNLKSYVDTYEDGERVGRLRSSATRFLKTLEEVRTDLRNLQAQPYLIQVVSNGQAEKLSNLMKECVLPSNTA